MTETQFLLALAGTKSAYRWQLEGKSITGVARNGKTRGQKFTPMTAVYRSSGLGTYRDNKKGRATAASQLGVTETLAENVMQATKAASNRGNYQVLRGKIRQVLNV